ncbi:E3 ubiquitin-protein ligase TRIM63-like [Mytilus trossulus]|uniref:E3 ubiquitin-protein ligase TRIM63-like n=1 Tax=Mytilus trossulus TaxID=6551 RepID=UPI003007ACC6
MASSTGKLCGPCEARYKTTTAVSWCMDYDDGLCSSCLEDHKVNKASKKHQTLPVSQYVGIESVSSLIKQECEEHDQRLTFYCLDHCVTACALCVPGKHKQCTNLKSIEELARNAKTSTELFDIEKGTKELDNTIDELKNHRQRNIDTIRDQQKNILREIKSLRKQINKHLDNIESDLLKELEFKSEQNISEINTLLAKLKERGANIKKLGKTIHQLKESLSDVQVFLATKSLSEKLPEEHEWVSMICHQDVAN